MDWINALVQSTCFFPWWFVGFCSQMLPGPVWYYNGTTPWLMTDSLLNANFRNLMPPHPDKKQVVRCSIKRKKSIHKKTHTFWSAGIDCRPNVCKQPCSHWLDCQVMLCSSWVSEYESKQGLAWSDSMLTASQAGWLAGWLPGWEWMHEHWSRIWANQWRVLCEAWHPTWHN